MGTLGSTKALSHTKLAPVTCALLVALTALPQTSRSAEAAQQTEAQKLRVENARLKAELARAYALINSQADASAIEKTDTPKTRAGDGLYPNAIDPNVKRQKIESQH